MTRRIALVAFKFPPYPLVGARRWTKLCKYLAREGIEIDVFTTNWGRSKQGLDDVSHPNIRVHRIPCFGLHRLWAAQFDRSTLKGKIGWFVERVATKFVRGWPIFEEARLWRRLPRAVVRVMESRDIRTVVATGGPFWAVHWAAEVKRGLPDARFIIDYRDPWVPIQDRDQTPPDNAIAVREGVALGVADAAVAVTDGLAEIVRAKAPPLRVSVVRNGCDPEEFPPPEDSVRAREPVILHAGSLFVGRERPLAALLDVLSSDRTGFDGLRFEFYGAFPAFLARRHDHLVRDGVLAINDFIPPRELMRHLSNAFACLHFNAEEFPFALSTKVFEYAYARRPVLSVNYGGEIERLVAEYGLGWSARGDDPSSIRHALEAIQAEWVERPGLALKPEVAEEFTYPKLAAQWSDLL